MTSDRDTILAEDKAALWHPYTRRSVIENETMPVIERAEGVFLYDMDGTRYIDAVSSWWCANLGHSHPRIVEAIQHQANHLQHSILGSMSHPPAARLASRLSALFTRPRHVHFASDGSAAVEAAIKIAIQYYYNRGQPDRHKIASLEGAYHGDTLRTMQLGYLETFHTAFKQAVGETIQAGAPCTGTCGKADGQEGCVLNCFESMRYLLENRGHELAAVIVEPLCQGASGMRIYNPDYLRELHALCQKHDILLIADEIAVGFGRTGKMWACEHAGIEADIICVGKGLSAGSLPISAAIVCNDIYETFSDDPEDFTFYHGHTFSGNPIACAAALACLDVYEKENIVEQSAALGRRLAEGLSTLHDCPHVQAIRCLGMIGAVELKAREEGAGRAQAIRQTLKDQGILIRPLGNVVYLMLPLVTPPDILEHTVSLFCEAIKSS
jgi:adenosylmethionine-8-amino-7-oxononanoate aminotransferase